jgi:hypothetical protein
VAARVNVSWSDQKGMPKRASAMLEDISLTGAGLRMGSAVTVGARLEVQWFRGNFSCIVKYCRASGMDYVVGVKKDTRLPDATPAPSKIQPATWAVTGRVRRQIK